MLLINISSDADKVVGLLDKMQTKVFPKALKDAANELGRIVHEGMKGEMKKRFDRPTDWTLGSLKFKEATTFKPEVNIWLKDQFTKGTAASQYLDPQIRGGSRHLKRHELKLIAANIMPADMYAVPAKNAPLDGYGNMPVDIINRILGDVRANGDQTPKASYRKRKGWKKTNYFFAGGKKYSMHLRPGIYWNLNGLIVPVLIFTRSPQYTIRYPFYEIGKDIYDRYKDRVIGAHMRAALHSNR